MKVTWCFSKSGTNFSGSFVTLFGTITNVRPCRRGPQISGTLSTNVRAVLKTHRSSLSTYGSSLHCHCRRFNRVTCGISTPLKRLLYIYYVQLKRGLRSLFHKSVSLIFRWTYSIYHTYTIKFYFANLFQTWAIKVQRLLDVMLVYVIFFCNWIRELTFATEIMVQWCFFYLLFVIILWNYTMWYLQYFKNTYESVCGGKTIM